MTLADTFIDNVIAHQVAEGRPMDCPIIVWIQQQRDRPLAEVARDLVSRPDWSPWFSREGLMKSVVNYSGADQQSLQLAYARSIAAQTQFMADGPLGRAITRILPTLGQPARDALKAWLA